MNLKSLLQSPLIASSRKRHGPRENIFMISQRCRSPFVHIPWKCPPFNASRSGILLFCQGQVGHYGRKKFINLTTWITFSVCHSTISRDFTQAFLKITSVMSRDISDVIFKEVLAETHKEVYLLILTQKIWLQH